MGRQRRGLITTRAAWLSGFSAPNVMSTRTERLILPSEVVLGNWNPRRQSKHLVESEAGVQRQSAAPHVQRKSSGGEDYFSYLIQQRSDQWHL